MFDFISTKFDSINCYTINEVVLVTYTYDNSKNKLSIILDEEIDVNSCKTLRTIIDGYIMRYSPKICELDLEKVSFMDSSGIGFVVGRKNLADMLNCRFNVVNANSNIKKLEKLQRKEILSQLKEVCPARQLERVTGISRKTFAKY